MWDGGNTSLIPTTDGQLIGIFIGWFLGLLSAIVGIIATYCLSNRSVFYNNFRQLYKEWLTPGYIKLNYSSENGLYYDLQEDPKWPNFFRIINKQLKRHKGKYLYKNAENDFNYFRKCEDKFRTEINLLLEVLQDFTSWDRKNNVPLNDYVVPKDIPACIDRIVKSGDIYLVDLTDGDGRYTLSCLGTIARTRSEDARNRLRGLILSIAKDEKVKRIAENKVAAEEKTKKSINTFNATLARICSDLQLETPPLIALGDLIF